MFYKDKPMLILITQSDTMKHTVKDGEIKKELCPKSEKDRTDVENYLRDTIEKNNMSEVLDMGQGKIITISTKLALTALENGNETLYDSSNMDDLLTTLMSITKGRSAELKQKNPLARFNDCLNEILAYMEDTKRQLNNVVQDTKEFQSRVNSVKKNVQNKLHYKIQDIISEKVQQMSDQYQKTTTAVSGKDIAKEIAEEVNREITKICKEEFAPIIPDVEGRFNKNVLEHSNIQVSDLEEKKKTIEYNYNVREVDTEEREGFGGWILDVLFGEKTVIVDRVRTKTVEVSLGLNKDSIENELTQYFHQIGEETIDTMLLTLTNGYIEPLQEVFHKLEESLDDTIAVLGDLKY